MHIQQVITDTLTPLWGFAVYEKSYAAHAEFIVIVKSIARTASVDQNLMTEYLVVSEKVVLVSESRIAAFRKCVTICNGIFEITTFSPKHIANSFQK
jgi:hypothetical protein